LGENKFLKKTKINISAFREIKKKETLDMIIAGICITGVVLVVTGTALMILAILLGWLTNL
jgi:hypothetical protein